MSDATPVPTLPRYQCHKQVRAARIESMYPATRDDVHGLTALRLEGAAEAFVDGAFITKHSPMPGGYFVVYDDGYLSYSPAAPFEAGYARLDP